MRLPRPALAVVLALSLGLVASCGVKSGELSTKDTSKTSSEERTSSDDTKSDETSTDDGTATTTTTDDTTSDETTTEDRGDLTPQQQQMVDTLTATYEKLGLDGDKAACLAEELARASSDPSDLSDPSLIMDAVNACDISMAELAELGMSGDGTQEGAFKIGLKTAFEEAGMTEEQATCVADGYVQKYGTDQTPSTDPQKMIALFSSCGVDPSTLNG